MSTATALRAACERCDQGEEIARLRNRLASVALFAGVLAEHVARANDDDPAWSLRIAAGVLAEQIKCAALGQPMPPAEWEAAADTERVA